MPDDDLLVGVLVAKFNGLFLVRVVGIVLAETPRNFRSTRADGGEKPIRLAEPKRRGS